jgi:transposase InsO family protein
MKYSFVTQYKKTWPIDLMCRVLGVSRQGYYHYRRNTEARLTSLEHLEMLEWMKDIAIACKYSYGRRRMKKAMNALGFPISRTQTVKLMKEADVAVRSKKKFKVPANSNHKLPLFENSLQRFDVGQPNKVFASDITYIWTQEGWLYLAVVIDLYSRKVVGRSMSNRMTAQLVYDALTMAIWLRRPKAGLIHHSDRGSQYASKAFSKLLKAHKFKGSMSRKGDCWERQRCSGKLFRQLEAGTSALAALPNPI